jgi:hypothetical protein
MKQFKNNNFKKLSKQKNWQSKKLGLNLIGKKKPKEDEIVKQNQFKK